MPCQNKKQWFWVCPSFSMMQNFLLLLGSRSFGKCDFSFKPSKKSNKLYIKWNLYNIRSIAHSWKIADYHNKNFNFFSSEFQRSRTQNWTYLSMISSYYIFFFKIAPGKLLHTYIHFKINRPTEFQDTLITFPRFLISEFFHEFR